MVSQRPTKQDRKQTADMESKPDDSGVPATILDKATEKETDTKPTSKDPAPTAGMRAPEATEGVPDPDEDDLDDLDGWFLV